MLVAMAMCTALYAVGSFATASIPSPWGFGQFRPAVIIPSFFACIFGPIPAAVGAAVGTLFADSAKHGTLHIGSLIAAVPGNFVGFYMFGYIVRKKFSWTRFISASIITLTVSNLIVAFLYVFAYKALYSQALLLSPDSLTLISIGLTIYWFVTMLPFVLLVTPLLIRAVARAIPNIVPEDVRINSLTTEIPKKSFSLAVAIPGAIMIGIGLATTFTPLGAFTASASKLASTLMIELMYYIGGSTLLVIGFAALIRQKMKK